MMTATTENPDMTHLVIDDSHDRLHVYFREPTPGAVCYTLAEFPISTPFTRRMAATVACEYSDQCRMPIDMGGLSLSLRSHCHKVERNRSDLIVTYRMKMEKVQ